MVGEEGARPTRGFVGSRAADFTSAPHAWSVPDSWLALHPIRAAKLTDMPLLMPKSPWNPPAVCGRHRHASPSSEYLFQLSVCLATGTECAFTHIYITQTPTKSFTILVNLLLRLDKTVIHQYKERKLEISPSLWDLLFYCPLPLDKHLQQYPPGTLCTGAQVGFPYFSLESFFFSICSFSCFGPCIQLSLDLCGLSSDFRGKIFTPHSFQCILPASPKAGPLVLSS